jgi:predicted transcriptional regulator
MTAVENELGLLLRSSTRTELLASLAESQPLDRYDLERRLDASRRTVTRALDALTERGYIREVEGEYVLSAFGASLAEAYRDCRRDVELASEYRPFLERVDTRTLYLDPSLLEGADLLLASERSPFVLLTRTLELRAEASRIREIAPGVEKRSVEQLAERLRNGEDLEVEVVLPATALEAAEGTDTFSAGHAVAREADAVDFYVAEDEFSAFVGVMDETVTVGAGTGGEPEVMVESNRPALRELAETRLDGVRDAATSLSEY